MTIPPVFRYRILQEAKVLLEKKKADFICEAISKASEKFDKYDISHQPYNKVPSYFPEILAQKPLSAHWCWFPLSPDGRDSRINLVRQAMEKLDESFQKTA